MKAVKKYVAILLIVFLIATSVPFLTFATEDVNSSMTISAEEIYSIAGETVEMDISVTDTYAELGAMSFTLEYDTNVLSLIEVVNGNALPGFTFNPAVNLTSGSEFSWIDMPLTNRAQDGTLMTLKFKISDTVSVGNYPVKISHDSNVYRDKEERPITGVTVNDGFIKVHTYKPGDATGNGICDIGDALRICRYLASGKTLEINTEAADANGDGKVDIADALRLCRFVAGHNVQLLPAPEICNHSMTATTAKDATCTEDGNIAYWYCSNCDKYFSDVNGKNVVSLADTVIEKMGHTEVIDEAVAPSYTTTGLTEGSHCSVCNEVIIAQIIIPVLKKEEYSITYRIANNDTYLAGLNIDNSNPSVYTTEDGLGLQDLVVDGYNFKGWYTAQTGGTKVTEFAVGTTGNKVLYAQWEKVVYTVTFDSPDVPWESVTYTVDTGVTLTNPTWFGYTFVG